jgi:esterase/lipase
MSDFSFNNGNLKLDGTLFYPPNKKDKNPAILFVHGWTSQRSRSFQFAKKLADLGFVCLLFDMRGHGTSQGEAKTFSNKDFLSDVVAAYDYLAKLDDVDKKNISAVGSSFGGYLVTLLSDKRKLKNLALRVPADYPNQDFNKSKMSYDSHSPEISNWRRQPKNSSETYVLEALNKFTGNVLIIEAEKDDIVPRQTISNYINAVKNKSQLTHILMKDAPHSIREGKFRDEVEQILATWFKNRL